MVVLVQQAVGVSGQTGRGAHSVVPQDVDDIIKPVQSVLHLRLQTPRDKKLKLLIVKSFLSLKVVIIIINIIIIIIIIIMAFS